MAVVINGSGTVTGLAVGGLPDGTVDEGTLAADSVTAAKIPAALENTFVSGRKNLIINGAMQMAQRGTSATVSDNSNEGYSTLDRYNILFGSGLGGSISVSQSSDAPNEFANSLKIQCASTTTPAAVNDNLAVFYAIEAQDLQHLSYGTSDAKTMTLSWYMKADNFSDPISIGLATQDGTVESFVVSKTPTSSWARYSVEIPGSTTATINNDNGSGMTLSFVLAGDTANSSIDAPSDTTAWTTTAYSYVTDIGNFLDSTSNVIYITGVQLELGSTATDFEHRSYGEELALCQRYCQKIGGTSSAEYFGYCYSGSNQHVIFVPFTTVMRAKPSFSTYETWVGYNSTNTNDTSVTPASNVTTYESASIVVNNFNATQGTPSRINSAGSGNYGYFIYDAEL